MASSKAQTVEDYLQLLPDDRRQAIERVRRVILDNLPDGYEEAMNWGMITYQIPLSTYPGTYNGQPLMYGALASQKNHMAVYLSNIYADEKTAKWFEKTYQDSGKPMDIGKSCVRFKNLADLPLDLIAKTIALHKPADFIKIYEAAKQKSS